MVTKSVLVLATIMVAATAACTGSGDHPAASSSASSAPGPSPAASAPSPVGAAPPVAVPPAATAVPDKAKTVTLRAPARGRARTVLKKLPTKGRAPKTGYSRARFGPAWTDYTAAPYGHNGCDTRDDMLGRQLNRVRKSGRCTVLSGDEIDPYTRAALYYMRGRSTVDIDHVTALGDAWQKGAQQLSKAQRTQFANDPLNLLSVSASANRQKGDSDAASWLPKNKSYRCSYVARQIAVKYRYRLWVTKAERAAMQRVLRACPRQNVPRTAAGRAAPAPAKATPTPPPSSSVYYANCTAVRAAGKAPLLKGQPGYRAALDRDGDGVACES
ncbi:MAG TPA: DUF1524 domain-containing protein [Jatrophihabitantaceae bacterium]|jgi:hypothetical protein